MKRCSSFSKSSKKLKEYMQESNNFNSEMNVQTSTDSFFSNLGCDNFASVSCFNGQTRIHLREYIENAEGVRFPTKNGISLTPSVWSTLSDQLNMFMAFGYDDTGILVIKRDLIVSKSNVNNVKKVSFQRIFQREDLSFGFLRDCFHMNFQEVLQLIEISENIDQAVKSSLLQDTLQFHVKTKLRKMHLKVDDYNGDPDRHENLSDLERSLCKCLKNFISLEIHKLIKCFGCMNGFTDSYKHECSNLTNSQQLDYFDSALLHLNWNDVAETFMSENLKFDYFIHLIYNFDFFDCLDTDSIYDTVKKLYVKENSEINLSPS